MAKPIKETPVLIGKDACNFIKEVKQAKGNAIDQNIKDRIIANFEKINALIKK